LFTDTAAAVLNPAFQRLVHKDKQPTPTGEPEPLPVTGYDHRIILLAETTPPGHLYLHEIIKDPSGKISIQFPGETAPTSYRVEGWTPNDPAPSSSRVSFYDRIALRPRLGQWQVWRFVNTTGDTHPMHIHQSQVQPLNPTGTRLVVTNADGDSLYPRTRRHRDDATVRRHRHRHVRRRHEPHDPALTKQPYQFNGQPLAGPGRTAAPTAVRENNMPEERARHPDRIGRSLSFGLQVRHTGQRTSLFGHSGIY
ncbi:MAG: multicopper oxidase domain-containing protein, partial [Mycobacteriales bacterium]